MFNPISFFCSSNLLVSHHELNFCTLTVVGWVERSEILVDAHLAIRPVFILDRLDLIGFNIYFDTYYTKSQK